MTQGLAVENVELLIAIGITALLLVILGLLFYQILLIEQREIVEKLNTQEIPRLLIWHMTCDRQPISAPELATKAGVNVVAVTELLQDLTSKVCMKATWSKNNEVIQYRLTRMGIDLAKKAGLVLPPSVGLAQTSLTNSEEQA